ncbi:MAG: hypothetical protein JOZ01_06075, partial [Candidatus Eremiobacteraeota bacterium]|nr:hypothetical protein [Candidatus Eremiobacteraeota bacterium]
MAMLRLAVALGIIAAFAGCANSASSGTMPATIPTQTGAIANATLAKASPGRVLYVGNIDGQPGLGNVLVYSAD